MNKILCRLNLHYWKYQKKHKNGQMWVKGVHRICKTCKLEQTRGIFGEWIEDFD